MRPEVTTGKKQEARLLARSAPGGSQRWHVSHLLRSCPAANLMAVDSPGLCHAPASAAMMACSRLMLCPSSRAEVFGHDLAGEPAAVRELIGLTGQFAAVDELLTGRENLEMFGRLFKLPGEQAHRRAGELLERFDLAQAADRPARTYSGGMRRRLDIASSLVTRPQVLFLDEPTTGLDPRSRNEIWAIVRELRREGTTILLTTQYLEPISSPTGSPSSTAGR
jgi:ABC-type Na+ transport system ATPase subunit NatA